MTDESKLIAGQLNAEHGLGKAEVVGESAVLRACDLLHEKGISPTIDAIRAVLGKGNRATINRFRQAWEAQRAELKAAISAAPAKPAKVIEMFDALWIEATRYGRQEAEALKEQLAARDAQHRKAMEELQTEFEASEDRGEALDSELETLRAELKRVRASGEDQLVTLRNECAEAQRIAAEAEARSSVIEAEHRALLDAYDKLVSRLPVGPKNLLPDPVEGS